MPLLRIEVGVAAAGIERPVVGAQVGQSPRRVAAHGHARHRVGDIVVVAVVPLQRPDGVEVADARQRVALTSVSVPPPGPVSVASTPTFARPNSPVTPNDAWPQRPASRTRSWVRGTPGRLSRPDPPSRDRRAETSGRPRIGGGVVIDDRQVPTRLAGHRGEALYQPGSQKLTPPSSATAGHGASSRGAAAGTAAALDHSGWMRNGCGLVDLSSRHSIASGAVTCRTGSCSRPLGLGNFSSVFW